jgi:hypothetical protein
LRQTGRNPLNVGRQRFGERQESRCKVGEGISLIVSDQGQGFGIHVERGRHFCDLDNYLDEWLQAERELKDKYNTSNNEGAKNKRDGCQNDHGCDPVPARSKEAGEHGSSEGNAYERRKSHVLGS